MKKTQEKSISVELVAGKLSQRVAHEIAGFWLLNGALSNHAELRRRIAEVLLVLRDPEGALVAVTSTYPYPAQAAFASMPCIGLRAFIAPAWRSLSLRALMFDSMVEALERQAVAPARLMFCTDNLKLMGKGNRRWFERRGWRRVSPEGAEKDEWERMIGPPAA